MLCCAFVFQFYSYARVFIRSIFNGKAWFTAKECQTTGTYTSTFLKAKKMATLGHPSTLQIPLVAKTCTMSRTSLQSAGIMNKFNIWCVGKGTARLTTPGNL